MRVALALTLLVACGSDEPPAGQDRLTSLEERVAQLEERVVNLQRKEADRAAREAEPEPEPPPPLERPPAPGPPSAAPPPVAEAPPTVGDGVTFYIRTPGVDAEIVDGDSGVRYGKTNAPGGVSIPRGDRPLRIVLRAAGYQDLSMKLVPTRDKVIVENLVPR